MTRAEKAQRLVDTGRVRNLHVYTFCAEARVQGDEDTYDTIIYPSGLYSCTCIWGRYRSDTHARCVHALAVKLAIERNDP